MGIVLEKKYTSSTELNKIHILGNFGKRSLVLQPMNAVHLGSVPCHSVIPYFFRYETVLFLLSRMITNNLISRM